MKNLTITILLLVCFLFCSPSVAEDKNVTDEALLEDLGVELLQPETDKNRSPLDEELLDQLGEDLGQSRVAEDESLAQVIKHMQAAQALLEQRNQNGGASAAQADAIVNLDSLITELTDRKSKCSGGSCAKPGRPGEKKPNSSKKAGKSPAKAAPTKTNSDANLSTDLAVAGELVKDLWGRLPQRQREQILQPLSEEFLPKYAVEIEAYFRDLADPTRLRTEAP